MENDLRWLKKGLTNIYIIFQFILFKKIKSFMHV